MNRSSPSTTTQALGRRGEELAAAYLYQTGYRLVASNFSLPVGRNRNGSVVNAEIDLVAYDDETLCFIEIKTRVSDSYASPAVNVDIRKQRQITRAARAYRRMLGLNEIDYRYDVVTVVIPSPQDDAQIELLRNFWREEKFRKTKWKERW